MKLVSAYGAIPGRHSTEICTGFLIKERGSSEKKMLNLFFRLILSSLLLNNLYLLSTCNFFPYPFYLFHICLSVSESSCAEDYNQVSNDEIPETSCFSQWILHLQLPSMIFRFRNMLEYLHFRTGLEVLRGS